MGEWPERDWIVVSPDLGERFAIGMNLSKVDAHCPIDGTQLVAVNEYDFHHYSCRACRATYSDRNPSQEELRKQAQHYLAELQTEKAEKEQRVSRLEKILQAARKNGLVT